MRTSRRSNDYLLFNEPLPFPTLNNSFSLLTVAFTEQTIIFNMSCHSWLFKWITITIDCCGSTTFHLELSRMSSCVCWEKEEFDSTIAMERATMTIPSIVIPNQDYRAINHTLKTSPFAMFTKSNSLWSRNRSLFCKPSFHTATNSWMLSAIDWNQNIS